MRGDSLYENRYLSFSKFTWIKFPLVTHFKCLNASTKYLSNNNLKVNFAL